ncbi:MAG: hypothetical protein E7500_07590 [Ruminococcus sp.]|nr:hypothetical protein [Ruminococcus sp.]
MMKTNSETGRKLTLVIGVYFIAKAILNMILGGGFGGIIYALIEAFALYTGLMYINYLLAVACVLGFVLNLKNNLTNLGSNWIYLVEGVIDLGCAFLLATNKDIKEHFTNKWTEIGDLFKK